MAARGKKNKKVGWLFLAVGVFLLVVSAVSALSIWR